MVLSTVKHTAFTILGAIALFSKDQLYFTSQWLTQEQEELPAVENKKQQKCMTEIWFIFTLHGFVSCCPELFHPTVFPLNFFLDMHVPDWPLLCNTEFQLVFCPAEEPHYATSSTERRDTRKKTIVYYTFSWLYSKGSSGLANLFDFTHIKH